MAAPSTATIKNLTGRWVMNKDLSDPSEPVLSLQGVSWLTRKAINVATIYLNITQSTKDNGITEIVIEQTATGGISGTTETRSLDWEQSKHTDHVFGSIAGRSRWINLDSVKEPLTDDYVNTEEEVKFLSEGWIEEESENGGPNGERHIDTFAVNEKEGWTARQIWGFAIINGTRYYVRRAIIKKKKEVKMVRLVYSWNPKQ
ncbi:hypothetical protein K3495_g10798 [Podosphaera aphanis]|nr:hypothetical protein K3495_g10798 [Podosphaera aphanis]